MSTTIKISDKEQRRFWSRVTLPNATGCMLWTGATNSRGYGHSKMAGRFLTSHRVSLILADGEPSSPELQAAHGCRNKHCVAPAHLRWATASENEADKRIHGVGADGERQAHARLTNAQARTIRDESAREVATRDELAARYGVSDKVIYDVLRGRTYRVAGSVEPLPKAGA